MELNRKSTLCFIAYWWTPEHRRPKTASLCVFVWRILFGAVAGIFVLAMFTILAGVVCLLLYGLMSEFWTGRHALVANAPYIGLAILGIIGTLTLLIGVNIFFKTDSGRIISEYVKAKKQKVCPTIKFT